MRKYMIKKAILNRLPRTRHEVDVLNSKTVGRAIDFAIDECEKEDRKWASKIIAAIVEKRYDKLNEMIIELRKRIEKMEKNKEVKG